MDNVPNDDIFSQDNLPGRDRATGWFSFSNVGDRIGGVLVDVFYAPPRGVFREQACFTIKTSSGEILNVGLKMSSYVLGRTGDLQIGDKVGFEFSKEIPPKEAGLRPAKNIVVYSIKVGPRKPGETVKDIIFRERGGGEIHFAEKDDAATGLPHEAPDFSPEIGLQEDGSGVLTKEEKTDVFAKEEKTDALDEAKQSIYDIAEKKGFITSAMTSEQKDGAIAAATGLDFTQENFPSIVIKLMEK